MKASIDSVGRIVVPKPLRDALGLTPGTTVDVSRYGPGLQLLPEGRTARLIDEDGVLVATGACGYRCLWLQVLVATGETMIDEDDVFGLIDAGRR